MEIQKPGVDIRPILTLEEAKMLVKKLYGFECNGIKELNGYDDKNFKIDAGEHFENEHIDGIAGDGYVLKIMNSLDSKKIDFVDAQNQLLIYLEVVIERDSDGSLEEQLSISNRVLQQLEEKQLSATYKQPLFAVSEPSISSGIRNYETENVYFRTPNKCNNAINSPMPVPNIAGSYYSVEKLRSGSHVIRLMKFIPGVLLHKAPVSPGLYYEIGTYTAKLDETLQKFKHRVYQTHRTLWMLESVPELVKFLFAVENEGKRRLLDEVIREFEDRVLSRGDELEKGMIHGDLNEQNILVEKIGGGGDWRMKAVLDFGDSQFSCYLFELAIAMTYAMIVGKSLDVGGYVLAGYAAVREIPKKEFPLLKICVEARLCQSLVMGAYTNAQDPGNTYVLTTSKAGWELLEELRLKSEEEVLERWKEISVECRGNFS